ncbi:MAG: hypothetical protein K2M55_04600 [Muribaculaceae bacterium]|nr:hypothetical protein [Muribaculaceae bacterium]
MHIFTRQSLFIGVFALAISATAAEAPVVSWGNWFDGTTTAGDNAIGLAQDVSGALYFLNTVGTTLDAPDAFYAGEKIFTGATGSSQSNSFGLTKTDAAGKAAWTIYTNSGDCDSQQGGVAVTADGSAVYFLTKVRHTSTTLNTPVTFVDAKGAEYAVGPESVENNYYFLVLGKATAEGAIEWLRVIEPGTILPADGSTAVSNAVYAKGFAIDKDENIYIGGNYRTPLTFTDKAGKATTITPRSVLAWNGDSQKTVGDLFMARFDAEGYFSQVLTTDGGAHAAEQIFVLTPGEDGTVYFSGLINPTEAEAIASIGGKDIPVGSTVTPITGAVDGKTLAVKWVTTLRGEAVDGKSAYQNPYLNLVGGTLWLTAQGNGSFSASAGTAATTTEQGTLREGLLVKFDAATGEAVKATASRTGYDGMMATALTGFNGAIQNPDQPEKVYVYGYGLNAAVGTYIRTYDATTLEGEADATWMLMTPQDKGTTTALNMIYDATTGTVTATGRCNKAIEPLGGEVSAAPTGWGVYAAQYQMPDAFISGVESVAAATSCVNVSAGKGCLVITAAETTAVAVCDLAGRTVATVAVTAGENATVNVAPGMYIAAGRKVLVR